MTSGGVEDNKNRSVLMMESQHHQPPPPFQGVSNYPPPPSQQKPPATGFPQQAQPYVPGYAVTDGPATEPLPCFGLGVGWVLFILGFFLGFIPWYVGAILLCCTKNRRERPGYIACAVAAVFGTIIIVVQVILFVRASSRALPRSHDVTL